MTSRPMNSIIILLIDDITSGNGLVSYYINLVLEGVGITDTETKVLE